LAHLKFLRLTLRSEWPRLYTGDRLGETRPDDSNDLEVMTMTLMEFLLLLVIAGIAGAIGQSLAGYDLGGCLVSIVVGFVGAYIGMWLAREFSLPEFLVITVGNEAFPVIWSVIGSALFALVVGMLTRRRATLP
jgi:uncharacterized membrane protein YeaQ/YmgE (transglycosylase-associated protein family)